jgi:ATP-dependent Zn protease
VCRDCRIRADLPAILEILLQNESLAADVDLARLAALTDGFSGSDLKREWESARPNQS